MLSGCSNAGFSGDATLRIEEDSLTVSSDHTDGGRPAICNNRPTTLTYRFAFKGNLAGWRAELYDPRGQIKPQGQDHTVAHDAAAGSEVEAQLTLTPGLLPLASGHGSALEVPGAQVAGEVSLQIRAYSRSASSVALIESAPLPVLQNCP
ncbi:hypothetical protein HNR42_001309 [Deinobacterium chartae]|uniref:Uncharacterized protein n=1 Tax=Deinobacterium chartae TaxID=521158 RepID=A0A841HYB9_9DEIO|nr:hypothetical protein [Deinobacterium chartae]MBB6097886.1 hypothetical protein [Deinobacterium chartae]